MPRMRLSESELNFTIFGSVCLGVQSVQPLATQKTQVTPMMMSTVVRIRFIKYLSLARLATCVRYSRWDAAAGTDNQLSGQALGSGGLATEELDHQVHGCDAEAEFGLSDSGEWDAEVFAEKNVS